MTLIGGLAGHGKTLLILAMAKALLEASPLFGYEGFAVQRPAQRVLYLICFESDPHDGQPEKE